MQKLDARHQARYQVEEMPGRLRSEKLSFDKPAIANKER